MTAPFTPTTEEVRTTFSMDAAESPNAEYAAQFNRWLAEVERVARADERRKVLRETAADARAASTIQWGHNALELFAAHLEVMADPSKHEQARAEAEGSAHA